MSRVLYRILGNFIFGFCTAFASVAIVNGGTMDLQGAAAGLIIGCVTGFIAAAKEMTAYGNYQSPDDQTAPSKSIKIRVGSVLEYVLPF